MILSFNDSLSPEPQYARSLSFEEPDVQAWERNNGKTEDGIPESEEVEKSPHSQDLGRNSKATCDSGKSPWLIETTPNKSPSTFKDIMEEEMHKMDSQLQSKKSQKPLIHHRPRKGCGCVCPCGP